MVTRSIDMDQDPLTAAIAPPPDESPEERERRIAYELEARRISDDIDDDIRQERAALRRRKKPVKVLLLGQSESGKSTTLKNFQFTYARNAWAAERNAWRAVIWLNTIRSTTTIIRVIEDQFSPLPSPPRSPKSFNGIGDRHRLLCQRLSSLVPVEQELTKRLGAGATEPTEDGYQQREIFVRSHSGWKSALDRMRGTTGSRTSLDEHMRRADDEAAEAIASAAEDIQELWTDPAVQALLTKNKIRMQDSSGFFLDDVLRVSSRDYSPSDDDVIRARLRTVGVQEYRFVFEKGSESGHEWLMYDVGGARSSRPAWSSYFDDVNAIIFLAPISCFDEKLAEDRKVNRLEDSFMLWKMVCSNKLLAKTQIILFLNKCDLLDRKLRSGIRVKDHVPSFGDRPNDSPTVQKYFRTKFRDMSKQYSPEPRPFYVFLTSVTDTKATAHTLSAVREGILRNHLRDADFL